MAMKAKYKFWVEKDGAVVVGNGRVSLLKLIDELGSIQKAADKMGMSYRHAWGFVRKVENRSGIKFVETEIGGREGGGARLTQEGREFLKTYSSFRDGINEFIDNKFKEAFKKSDQRSAVSNVRKTGG
jgi:molybdate transport system regulatory protein